MTGLQEALNTRPTVEELEKRFGKIFIVNVEGPTNKEYSADKTYQETFAALTENKMVAFNTTYGVFFADADASSPVIFASKYYAHDGVDVVSRAMLLTYTEASGIRIESADLQKALTFDDTPTSGSNNPVKSKGIKSALDTLDGKIDAIIGGNATLNLSVSPASIFANASASVTVTATASMQATSINIKKGGITVQSGSNTTSINYTETVTLSSGEAITYSAEGVINGVTKTVSNKTVRAYDKIYYGVGTENNYSGITTYQSIRTNANGTYAFSTTAENRYAYILIPHAMSAINLNNVKLDSGFGYNMTLITDNATIDNTRYRVYRSAENAVGESFNVVIS